MAETVQNAVFLLGVIPVWMASVFGFLFNASGWLLGQTYDYTRRRRTYHGTKMLLCGAILVVMYHLPYEKWELL